MKIPREIKTKHENGHAHVYIHVSSYNKTKYKWESLLYFLCKGALGLKIFQLTFKYYLAKYMILSNYTNLQ